MAASRELPTIGELIEEHYQFVYRYAYWLSGSAADADDLTQETFLIAQEKLHQLRNPDSVSAWLCTIARNEHLRIRKRERLIEIKSLEAVAEPSEMVVETAIDEQQLQRGLKRLPEEYRTPLILFYFNELRYKDIAAVMEVPIGTVMSRLARAKSSLKALLSDTGSMAASATTTPPIPSRK